MRNIAAPKIYHAIACAPLIHRMIHWAGSNHHLSYSHAACFASTTTYLCENTCKKVLLRITKAQDAHDKNRGSSKGRKWTISWVKLVGILEWPMGSGRGVMWLTRGLVRLRRVLLRFKGLQQSFPLHRARSIALPHCESDRYTGPNVLGDPDLSAKECNTVGWPNDSRRAVSPEGLRYIVPVCLYCL